MVAVAQAYDDFYNDECDPRIFPNGAGWKNKMFVRADLMPWRIKITGVKIEQLQEISDEDCMKEGIVYIKELDRFYFEQKGNEGFYFSSPRKAFSALIDRVAGKGTWERNPFVFAYEFELLEPPYPW